MSKLPISQEAIEHEIMKRLIARDKLSIVTTRELIIETLDYAGGIGEGKFTAAKIIESLKKQGKIKEITQTLIIPV